MSLPKKKIKQKTSKQIKILRVNKISKVSGFKINMQKSVWIPQTHNGKFKRKLRKQFHL